MRITATREGDVITHVTGISERKIAYGVTDYIDGWLGAAVIFRTYEGEALVGHIERFDGTRPVLTFADGGWAFGSVNDVEVVDAYVVDGVSVPVSA